LHEIEHEEYNNMCKKFKSGDGLHFEEFLEMIDRMRKPLICQINGHEVSLLQDGCAIMMETSAIHAITDSLFVGTEKQNGQGNNAIQQQNKQQQNGNQTVRTECGATGIVALYQTAQCNDQLKRQEIKKAKDKLQCESKNISTTLTSLSALKQKKPNGYWFFSLQSSQQELSMLLWLLAPESGVISKGKHTMWCYIEDKIIPMLLQASVDEKAEEYTHCLATIAEELAALQAQDQQLEDPVEDTPASTDDPLDETNVNEDRLACQPAGRDLGNANDSLSLG